MIFLITGTCLIQSWSASIIQMTYRTFHCALLASAKHDPFLSSKARPAE